MFDKNSLCSILTLYFLFTKLNPMKKKIFFIITVLSIIFVVCNYKVPAVNTFTEEGFGRFLFLAAWTIIMMAAVIIAVIISSSPSESDIQDANE